MKIAILYAKGVGSTNKAKLYVEGCESNNINYITISTGEQHENAKKVIDPDYIIDILDFNSLLQICINENIDVILPCNELVIGASSFVSEKLNLPHHLSSYHAKLLIDKYELYTFMKNNHINCFNFWPIESKEQISKIKFDGKILIKMKTGSNASKRGMIYENIDHFLNSDECDNLIKCNQNLEFAEEYFNKPWYDIGGVFICEFIKPKKIVSTQLLFTKNKLYHNPYCRMVTLQWPNIGNSGFDSNPEIDENVCNDFLIDIFQKMKINEIFLGPEILIDENDKMFFMDANPRLCGDNSSRTWKILGCDIMDEYIKYIIDNSYEPDFSYKSTKYNSWAYRYKCLTPGYFNKEIKYDDEIFVYDNYDELKNGLITKNSDINIHAIGTDIKSTWEKLNNYIDELNTR